MACSSMSADLVIGGYVRIAKQDLDGARLLNRAANRNAAYLCEQAAEKLIRAVLTRWRELPLDCRDPERARCVPTT